MEDKKSKMSNKVDLKDRYIPKRGNIPKIVELGMEEDVIKMYVEGNTLVSISDFIEKKTKIRISRPTIKKFIDNTRKSTRQIAKTNIEIAEKQAYLNLNYQKVLYDILSDNKDVQQMALDSEDFAAYASIGNLMNKNLQLYAKLNGEFDIKKETSVNVLYEKLSEEVSESKSSLKDDLLAKTKKIKVSQVVKQGNNISKIEIEKEFEDEKPKEIVIDIQNEEQ